MFNMATMAADECRLDQAEAKFRAWLDEAGKILGRYIADGTEDESALFDLFLDRCTPAEAVNELLAQYP